MHNSHWYNDLSHTAYSLTSRRNCPGTVRARSACRPSSQYCPGTGLAGTACSCPAQNQSNALGCTGSRSWMSHQMRARCHRCCNHAGLDCPDTALPDSRCRKTATHSSGTDQQGIFGSWTSRLKRNSLPHTHYKWCTPRHRTAPRDSSCSTTNRRRDPGTAPPGKTCNPFVPGCPDTGQRGTPSRISHSDRRRRSTSRRRNQ